MNRIQVLPPQVVDMIAAGEVIERPASIVKELVENSLDAGASVIAVAAQGGGRDLVSVVDDGCGIEAADLPLAVASHATSKLRTADDLFRIGTLGFRGEALASIAAVSIMKVSSKAQGALSGAVIEVRGGVVGPVEAAGLPQGTAIEVRKLFFNAPVRRRFLRKEATEMSHISAVLTEYALAHPKIRFSLTSDGKGVFDAEPAADIRDRIALFYSRDLASSLVAAGYDSEGFALKALVAPPEFAAGNPRSIHAFLNGRAVRDKTILHAVSQAYRDSIPRDRHPVAFLFLKVHPEEVDVNVHPGKLEVRFRDQGKVHALVERTLREALETRESAAPAIELKPAKAEVEGDAPQIAQAALFGRDGPETPRERVAEAIRDYMSSRAGQAAQGRAGMDKAPWDVPGRSHPEPAERAAVSPPPAPARSQGALQAGQSMQVHGSYIVRETAEGIEIIDQHALAERVLYDKIRPRIEKEGLAAQRLLVPITVDVRGRSSALLAANAELFRKFGLEVDRFGPSTFAVHTIPAFLPDSEVAGFIEEALDEIAENRSSGLEDRIDAISKRMACKAAVKAGTRLN